MKPTSRLWSVLSLLLSVPTLSTAQQYCTVEQTASLTIIRPPQGSRMFLTDRLPAQGDVLLCIPAAFTSPEGTVQGAYVVGGQRHGTYNRHSKVSISGQTFTLGSTITTDYGFQQMCLVRGRNPIHFRDNSRYIRRALCTESSNSPAVVMESKKALTMNEFAQLLATRVHNAVYTDMGSYGFGWYYASSSPTYLSPIYFFKQHKQTNWIVWKK